MIKYSDPQHIYTSVIPDNRKWVSVTRYVENCKEKFNPEIANRNAVDPQSKWYGLKPDYIRQLWKEENERSTKLGSWYHKKMEELEPQDNICKEIDGWKYAGDQQLVTGVYPEYILYHPEYNVCGTADRIECKGNVINISDYKTNKKLSYEGFRGKGLLKPVSHLEDCHINHYSLQMSLYALMCLYHNPGKQIDTLTVNHVVFEEEGVNEWGYPIYQQDPVSGDYKVKSVTPIKVSFLEKEALSILQSVQPL